MRSSTILALALASFTAAQVNDAKKKTTSTTAVAATTAPTACSATVNQPFPTGVTCDKSGTLKTPAYYGGAFGEVNRDACAAVCATIEGCNSFLYNQDQSTCQLFSQTLQQMGFKAVKDNGAEYYGLGCFGCAPMPTTTSSSVTSTSTSATSSVSSTSTTTPSTTLTTSTTSSSTGTITAAPSCTSTAVTVISGTYTDVYKEFFSGTGVTESPSNPGNKASHPAVTYELTDTDACSALQDCASMADPATGTYYNSFDVHYLESTANWECVVYYNKQNATDAAYFNVTNADVGTVYGFST